jgi:muconolactone delta-isomerase
MSGSSYSDVIEQIRASEQEVLEDQKRLDGCMGELSRTHGEFRGTKLCAGDTTGNADSASESMSAALDALHYAGTTLGSFTQEVASVIDTIESR